MLKKDRFLGLTQKSIGLVFAVNQFISTSLLSCWKRNGGESLTFHLAD